MTENKRKPSKITDRQRLDWLGTRCFCVSRTDSGDSTKREVYEMHFLMPQTSRPLTLRQAVDRALRAERKERHK